MDTWNYFYICTYCTYSMIEILTKLLLLVNNFNTVVVSLLYRQVSKPYLYKCTQIACNSNSRYLWLFFVNMYIGMNTIRHVRTYPIALTIERVKYDNSTYYCTISPNISITQITIGTINSKINNKCRIYTHILSHLPNVEFTHICTHT